MHTRVPVPTDLFLSFARFLEHEKDTRNPITAVSDALEYWMDNASWKPELLRREPPLVYHQYSGEANCCALSIDGNGATNIQPALNTDNVLPGRALGLGDQAFLSECRRYLNDTLVTMSAELVHAFRSGHPGTMVEGKARKWVNRPSRFVAIRLQTCDQSLLVSVKGKPHDFIAPTLRIKSGWRPSWSEFKLKHAGQLEDAIRVVLASAAGGAGY